MSTRAEMLAREGFFWFPSAKSAFFCFERAIFDHFWSSTAPALRSLAVSRSFGARPPVHFGDLELTGNKKMLPSEYSRQKLRRARTSICAALEEATVERMRNDASSQRPVSAGEARVEKDRAAVARRRYWSPASACHRAPRCSVAIKFNSVAARMQRYRGCAMMRLRGA